MNNRNRPHLGRSRTFLGCAEVELRAVLGPRPLARAGFRVGKAELAGRGRRRAVEAIHSDRRAHRKSGLWRETRVNLLAFDGGRYLVAPRGEAQWVRNLRVAGNGQPRVGCRVQSFEAQEVDEGARSLCCAPT